MPESSLTPSGLQWLMDDDGDWELYDCRDGFEYKGLVGANRDRTKWMAFCGFGEIGPFDTPAEAGLVLVSRVNGGHNA